MKNKKHYGGFCKIRVLMQNKNKYMFASISHFTAHAEGAMPSGMAKQAANF